MAKTLTQVKEEYEKKQKTRKTLDQVRYSHEKEKIKSDISAKIKDYEAEVKKYGDIYNSTFFDSNGKAKTGYIGNVGEQGKAATIQAANIVSKRNAVQSAIDQWSDYLDNDYKASISKYFADSNNALTKLSKDFQNGYDYYSQFKDEADFNQKDTATLEGARKKIAALEAEKAEIEEWLKNPQYLPLSDNELKQETTPEARERAVRMNQQKMRDSYNLAKADIEEQITSLQKTHFPGEVRTWFDAGAFEDGWQRGDLGKTINATVHDLEANILGGGLNMIEGIADAGAYALGGIGRLMGSHWFQDRMTDFIQKDLYNYLGEDIHNGADIINALNSVTPEELEASLLGDKTDSLIQSGGQLAATVATTLLSKGLIPWWVTTGASSFGGQAETALNEGASYGQAGVSALITAGAEILSEKLSGGISFGGGTLDDVVLDPLLDKISNKVVKALAKTGIDAAGEGFEEIFSGVVSNLGTALYKDKEIEDILMSEEALDEYVEGFIGGAVLGGAMGGVRNTGEAIADAKNTMQTGNRIQQTPSAVDELVELGRSLPQTANLADKVSTNPTAYKTGRLYERVGQTVTPENEEGVQKYTRLKNELFYAIEQSPAVSAEAADRINMAFTQAIDKTELPEKAKSVIAQKFVLPSNIEPNSYEAEKYARDFADDAALAYEAGEIQQKTGEKLPDGWLQQKMHVVTPEQADYYTKLGREAVLSKEVEDAKAPDVNVRTTAQTQEQYIADTPERVRARKKLLARSADEVRTATRNDTTLTAEQREAAEFGEKIGVAVGFVDATQYYSTKRDGISLKSKGIIILDKKTENPLKQVFIHELGHFSETSKSYAKLSKKIMESKALDNWLTEKGYTGSFSNKKSAYRAAKKNAYSENGVALTKDGADAEMIANFLGETIGTEEKFNAFMSELTKEQKKNFLDYIKEVIDWFKSIFTNSVPAEIRQIERLYKKAIKESGNAQKAKAGNANVLNSENGEEQFKMPASRDRANKQGDLINDYYQALDKKGWRRYYGIIAEKGWLLSDIGDVAAVVIDNKLIISQRKSITNDTNDFQVIDAYKIEGDSSISHALKKIADKIEWGQEYDYRTVCRIYGEVIKLYDENAVLTRYNRAKYAFVENFTETSDGGRAKAYRTANRAKASGKGILEGTSKTVQETVQGSIRDGTVTEDEQFSISDRKFNEAFITDTLQGFGITKPKDYIHVQRQVFSTLLNEGFFTDKEKRSRVDVNKASGMIIETNKSSIDETFNRNNYALVGINKKIAKLATVRLIPQIIENGTLVKDNVPNQHKNSNNKTFAYIEANVVIEGKDITIKVDIKQSPRKNKVWVHKILSIENVSSFPASTENVLRQGKTTADSMTIAHFDENVNTEEQYSIPREAIVERKERTYGNSIPERTRKLRQDYADGKIRFDELVAGETQLMEEAREKYGTIEEGENPQERVKVPQGVEKNKNVSQYVRTILETGVVSEALAAEIGEKTLLGEFSHKVLTDEKALEDADKAIKNGTARNKWGKTAVDIHRIPTKNEIAVGEKLLEKAMKDGKTTEYNFKKLFLKNRKSFFCSYFKT